MEYETLAAKTLANILEVYYAPHAEYERKQKALSDIESLAAQLRRDLEKSVVV